jgi:hypothetical protein
MSWLRSLSIGRHRAAAQIDAAVTASEPFDEWKIHSTRKAISEAWSTLAEKNLTPAQRKAVREHLDINIAELQRLLAHQKDARRPNNGSP